MENTYCSHKKHIAKVKKIQVVDKVLSFIRPWSGEVKKTKTIKSYKCKDCGYKWKIEN